MNDTKKQVAELDTKSENSLMSNIAKYGLAPVLAVGLSNSAFALDISQVTGKMDDAGTMVDTVGIGLIGLAATIMVIFLIVGLFRRA